MSLAEGTKFMVISPAVSGKKGMHEKVFDDARRNGYARVRVDGYVYALDEVPALDKNKKHSIDIVVDRLVMKPDIRRRLSDSLETALSLGGGVAVVYLPDTDEEMRFSQNYACEEHGVAMTELEPRMFSFNNPFGACENAPAWEKCRSYPRERSFRTPRFPCAAARSPSTASRAWRRRAGTRR